MTLSPSSARNNPRAFTLLELIIVLAIAALLAGLAVPAAARAMAGATPRSTLTDLRANLALARAAALKAGEPVQATVTLEKDALSVTYQDKSRAIRAAWLPDTAEQTAPQSVRFDPMGLADRRKLQFSAPSSDDAAPTIWAIPFDPVSGAVGKPAPEVSSQGTPR